MQISLIVTTYNRPDALLLVLKSIKAQTHMPFEIIIADDGSSNLTKQVINKFSEEFNIRLIHSYQEDLGFRVAESRNKAIAIAQGEYIVLIDGDMLLHKDFVKDHVSNAEQGFYIQGSRVLLEKIKTNEILISKIITFSFFEAGIKNRLNAIHSKLLSKIFTSKKNFLRGVKSCNMSFYKSDCIKINGFNSSFIGWGREDSEFVIRLLNNKIRRKSLKFSAIQYHLWHNESNRKSLPDNDKILKKTIEEKLVWCEEGINKFL